MLSRGPQPQPTLGTSADPTPASSPVVDELQPVRLLHVGVGNIFGGIETLLVSLARERRHCATMEPHFALCFEGRLEQELREAAVPVTLLGSARVRHPWTIRRVRRRLVALLDQQRFDAVVVHGCWAHVVVGPAVEQKGIALIHWAHSVASGHWLERWARRTLPALVIANSRYTAQSMRKLFPGVPTEVVYCPLAAPPPCDREAVRARVRSALGTPLDATVIIMASRLEALKGHRLLLETLSFLREEPNWVCWIIGGPQRPREARYREELGALAVAAGISDRVLFLGQREDVPDLLAAADIYCQPNEGPESFGIGFLEALYAELPVLTTSIGGALEIVDESCGVLIAVDSAQLADALRSLVRAPAKRERLGRAGRARAHALGDPAARLTQLHHIITPIVTRYDGHRSLSS